MCVQTLSRRVGLALFLGAQGNALLTTRLDRDGLRVYEARLCAGVLVGKVEWVPGELDAAASLAFDKVGIV